MIGVDPGVDTVDCIQFNQWGSQFDGRCRRGASQSFKEACQKEIFPIDLRGSREGKTVLVSNDEY